MALQTKTFSIGSLTDKSVLNGYILELTVTEQSTSTVNNTSSVDFSLKLRSGSKNRFTLYGLGASVSLAGNVVGSRDRYEEDQVSLGYNSSVTLVSGSTTVAHSDDGTKTVAVAFSIDMKKSDYTPGPVSVTGETMTLTTIPRASTVAATDANIGAVSTVVVNRKSTAFTHTVAVSFGEISGYLNADGALVDAAEQLTATAINFTVPESFYAQIPNAPSGTCAITCTTYSGTSVIGTKTATFTATAAKDLCAPEVTVEVKDVNGETLALTGDENTLIRFFSTARCVVTATAKNSATVTALTVEGQTVEGGEIDFPNAEQDTYTAVATDSRGYRTAVPGTAALIPYIQLTCNASAKRLSPTGGDALVTVKGIYYNGSFGAEENALALYYRVNGGEDQPAVPVITEDGYTAEIFLEGLDYTQSHTIEILAEDCLQSVSKNVTVNPGIPVFDWGKQDFAFHVPVSLPSLTVDGVSPDLVIETGTAEASDGGVWTYVKWQSGRIECYGQKNHGSVACTTATGSLYRTGELTAQIPEGLFAAAPDFVDVSFLSGGYAGWVYRGSGKPTATAIGKFFILRPVTCTYEELTMGFRALGKWK